MQVFASHPFFFQMPHEIGEERPPHLVEGGLARFGLHVHPLARRGVAVVQHIVPRQHRVAVDLFVDAQPLHELHPAVEGRIVVCPRAVGALRPDDHVGVGVVALVVPRILVERRRDDLLSGVGQRLHHGAERLEMGVAPHLRPSTRATAAGCCHRSRWYRHSEGAGSVRPVTSTASSSRCSSPSQATVTGVR